MKVVRILSGEDARYGLADDDTVTLISDEPFAAWETEDVIELADAHLLAPAVPTKIVCVGLNYKKHAAELDAPLPDEPVIFLKPSTAINSPGGDIEYPSTSQQVDYEGELA